MDDRVLVLWATPRSTSTAFEWMMRMRGDLVCLHEPFGVACYRADDRRTTRPDQSEPEPGRTYASTWREIRETRQHGRVFSKDFPNYIKHMADDEFVDHFEHTFLIRDPAKALPSMFKHWQEFTMDEAGYEALYDMFRLVTERYAAIPPVIDSDDLLDNPAGIVQAYCESAGLTIMPEALEWEEGRRDEVRWYGGGWHDTLQASTGLKRQPIEQDPSMEDFPFLREMYARCLPFYDELFRHRITASGVRA